MVVADFARARAAPVSVDRSETGQSRHKLRVRALEAQMHRHRALYTVTYKLQ